MMTETLALNIPPAVKADAGGFDLLSLGAMVHRLDPGVVPMRKAELPHPAMTNSEVTIANTPRSTLIKIGTVLTRILSCTSV